MYPHGEKTNVCDTWGELYNFYEKILGCSSLALATPHPPCVGERVLVAL